MKSDLDELIELLEEEVKLIQVCIKKNIDEWDYQMAHYNSRALFNLDQKLSVLYKMKDPYYEKKANLERMIKLYEGRLNMVPHEYYQEIINEDKNKLYILNQQKGVSFYDDQKIDDALFSVWAGIYKGFKLFLRDDLCFVFESVGDEVLNILVNIESALNVECFFDDDEDDRPLDKFKGLGFIINDAGNKLVYKYYMGNLKDASEIKILLARIIYDVLNHTELDKAPKLEYF